MRGNKLRTYRTFKTEYRTEGYINLKLPRLHRSAYAKFRCGVAPLWIETVRYERLHLDYRHCFHCTRVIESEEHVILNCPLYEDFIEKLFYAVWSHVTDFDSMSDSMKLSTILGNENATVIRSSAKTCHDILMRRRTLLYHWIIFLIRNILHFKHNDFMSFTVSHNSLRMVLYILYKVAKCFLCNVCTEVRL